MSTQAISSYGIQLRLGNGVPLTAVGITGVTTATPMVVTTASAHGIPVGDVDSVVIAGVGGINANGSWVAQALSTTTVRLKGSAGVGTYTSGGTLQRTDTFTLIAEVTNLRDIGGSCTLVDCTAHDGNGFSSRIPTFLQGDTLGIDVNLVPHHSSHDHLTGLESLLLSKATRHWLVVFPGGTMTAWRLTGFVSQHRSQAPVAGVLTSAIGVEQTDSPIFAA